MTNTNLLRKAIENSGLKKKFIAQTVGLSYQGYLNKETGKTEFTQSEIETISNVLRIDQHEREKIFFDSTVD